MQPQLALALALILALALALSLIHITRPRAEPAAERLDDQGDLLRRPCLRPFLEQRRGESGQAGVAGPSRLEQSSGLCVAALLA